jgi:hypothetical protein
MKYSRLPLLVPVLALMMYSGCKRRPSISAEKLDSIRLEYKSLSSASADYWRIMMEEDDKKLFYMKRLLQEVSYADEYDSLKYAELMGRLESLKASRYDEKSMANSSLIDQYDSLTIDLVPEIEQYARALPDFSKYPLMQELIDEINEMDNNVLFKRVDYDNAAEQYNALVNEFGTYLQESDPGGDYAAKPLFKIVGE